MPATLIGGLTTLIVIVPAVWTGLLVDRETGTISRVLAVVVAILGAVAAISLAVEIRFGMGLPGHLFRPLVVILYGLGLVAIVTVGWSALAQALAARSLVFPLLLSVTVSTVVVIAYGAWVILWEIGTGFLLTTRLLHVAVHARVLRRNDRPPRALLLIADLLLVATAVLRWDEDDMRPYSVIGVLLEGARGSVHDLVPQALIPAGDAWIAPYNGFLYLPLFAVYALALRAARRARTRP